MSIIVEIPDVGEVEFPSTMSQEEIRAAIIKIVGRGAAPQVAPQPPVAPVAPPVAPVAPVAAPIAPTMQAPVAPQAAPVAPPVAPVAPPVAAVAPQPPAPLQLFAPRTRIQQESLPFQSVAEMGATPSAAFRAGVQTDKKAAIKEFAKARGIPESRYRIVGNDIVYEADDGNFYAEIPGILRAPRTSLAYVAPDIAEALPSIATGIASAPMMLGGPAGAAGSVALTGGAASLANVGRQKIAGLISGEDRPLDVGQVATSGLLDAATQLIPGGRVISANARTAADIGRLDPAAVAELQRIAQARGIQ